jgi:hypothetical protein
MSPTSSCRSLLLRYPCQVGVHSVRRARKLDNLGALRAAVEMVNEPLAFAEEDRHDGQVQIIDQPDAQVLLDRHGAATEQDVRPVRGRERAVQRTRAC